MICVPSWPEIQPVFIRCRLTFKGADVAQPHVCSAAPIGMVTSVLHARPVRSWAMCHWSERSERKRHPFVNGSDCWPALSRLAGFNLPVRVPPRQALRGHSNSAIMRHESWAT